MNAPKVPLIELLKTLHPTRDEKELNAQILRGQVFVAGEKVVKPGTRVPADAVVRVNPRPPFASRGGEKLAAALSQWGVSCAGVVWIDAGSSTGGFTDCLLRHGAVLVYAVDVGQGQLAWHLRGDARVRAMEGTNIMDVRPGDLDPAPARAVADLSFRSLRGAARHILDIATEGWGIFLVKPQFELGSAEARTRDGAGEFRGVVRDAATIRATLRDLIADLAVEGVFVEKLMPSPIRGRKGNREFLFLMRAGGGALPSGDPGAMVAGLVLE